MKIAPASIDTYIKKPSHAFFLVYGPDIGLVKERVEALLKFFVDDIHDPFNVSELSSSQIVQDPATLYSEVQSQSLMGGQRVIWIRNATDGLKKTLSEALKGYDGENIVLVEAGDLPARSSLRLFFDKESKAASIACYKDEVGQLRRLIFDHFKAESKQVNQDALFYLLQHLGDDRMQTRQELNKISLYCADKAEVNLVDVQNCTGDHSYLSMEELGYAIAEANYNETDRIYTRLINEGVSEVYIIRTVLRHFHRLYETALWCQEGLSAAEAIKKLKPPPFFKFKDRFLKQLNLWSVVKLQKALQELKDLEIHSKTTHMPLVSLCEKYFFKLADLVQEDCSKIKKRA